MVVPSRYRHNVAIAGAIGYNLVTKKRRVKCDVLDRDL
jgi:hypothetical protein